MIAKFFCFCFVTALAYICPLRAADTVYYMLRDEPIDVVIPCHAKDLLTLDLCIYGIQKNGANIGRIIVVSKQRMTERAEWVPESYFPFTTRSITEVIFDGDDSKAGNYLESPGCRVGWILQQLIKLYAAFVIPDISSNVLVLDADTIFLNPVHFLNEKNGACLTIAQEDHAPYFVHAKKLIPGFQKEFPAYSGIAHHMLFQKAILEDLFSTIETYHQIPTWQAFCKCIDLQELPGSSMSEYEVYFNFALSKTNQVSIRNLNWCNIDHHEEIQKLQQDNCTFVSWHSYLR